MLQAVPLVRSSFTDIFICDITGPDDPQPLHDAHLVHADQTRLVLSGYECIRDVERDTHFGQTWVLMADEGPSPQASIGPPFPR